MNEITLIEHLSVDSLTEALQDAGYRVNRSEQNGVVQLLSASQGIYAVRFGNPAATPASLDFTFSCALRVQGELPAGLTERWNLSRRFGRLSQQGEFLVMEMDVIVAGGVSPANLRNHIELWDRLLQEFIAYLRDYSRLAAGSRAWRRMPVNPSMARPEPMRPAFRCGVLAFALAVLAGCGQREDGGAGQAQAALAKPSASAAARNPRWPPRRLAGGAGRTEGAAGRGAGGNPRAVEREPRRTGTLDARGSPRRRSTNRPAPRTGNSVRR